MPCPVVHAPSSRRYGGGGEEGDDESSLHSEDEEEEEEGEAEEESSSDSSSSSPTSWLSVRDSDDPDPSMASLVAGKHLSPLVVRAYVEYLIQWGVEGAFLYGPLLFQTLFRANTTTGAVSLSVRCGPWKRLLARLMRFEAVFIPLQADPPHWCLYVLIPHHKKSAGGVAYIVDSVSHKKKESSVHQRIDEIVKRLPGSWNQHTVKAHTHTFFFFFTVCCVSVIARLPCHPILADGSTSGIRMLHHLHVLLLARFWTAIDEDSRWVHPGHPWLKEPIDGMAERIHVRRAVRHFM